MKKITFFTLCLSLFLVGSVSAQETVWVAATASGAANGTSEADAYGSLTIALLDINSAGDILKVVGTVAAGSQNLSSTSATSVNKNFAYTIEGVGGGATLAGAPGLVRMFTINAASVGQDVTFKNITFSGSTGSTGAGGSVFFTNQANVNVTFENCRFVGNSLVSSVTTGGGALNITNSTVTITNCLFKENQALQMGGAIAIYNNSNVTMTGCTFYKNSTTGTTQSFGGGVLYVTGAAAVVNVDHCTFFQNNIGHPNQDYGTIRSDNGNTTIKNSLFYDNKVTNTTVTPPVLGGPSDWGSSPNGTQSFSYSLGQWITINIDFRSNFISFVKASTNPAEVAANLASSNLTYDDVSGKVKYGLPTAGDATPIGFGSDGKDAGAWDYGAVPAVPAISGLTSDGTTAMTQGCGGSALIITGTNLTGATALTVNGVAVASFVVNNSTTITATLPNQTITAGLVVVTTLGGTATSAGNFAVNATPNAGTDGTLSICAGTTPTEAELFAQLGGTPVTGGTWSNSGLVYTYTVNATLPCTVVDTATVTVTEQAQPNAGTDGELTVYAGTTPTNAELFARLTGADAGGSWTNVGLVYTYTVNAIAPCTGNDTATVAVTELAVPSKTVWVAATASGAANGTSEANAYGSLTIALLDINSAGDILRVVGTVAAGSQNLTAKNFAYTIEGVGGGATLAGTPGLVRMFTINAASAGQDLTFKNITFSGQNSSIAAGGAVLFSNQAGVTINFENCRFNGNTITSTTAAAGGALVITNSTVTITDCLFKENTAVRDGGAISIGNAANVTMTGCTFYKNSTTSTTTSQGGGALYVTGATSVVTIDHCTFFQNNVGHSNQDYGTIRTDNGNTTVTNSLFYDNKVKNINADGTLGGPSDWGGSPLGIQTFSYSIGQWITSNIDVRINFISFVKGGLDPLAAANLASSNLRFDEASGKVIYDAPTAGDATPIGFGSDGKDAGAWDSELNLPGTPTFTPVDAICSGVSLSALPTTSNNGITGTWSPALNNSATTTYTFTPSAGQSAITATMTIEVNRTPKAGTDGTLTVCAGTTPTNAELFARLTGADAGGSWTNVGLVYTYTVNATAPCTENDTATVAVTELAVPSKPVTTAVTYCQNQAAMALTASGITTSTINWYDDPSTVTPYINAPTPSTDTVGTFNYYVSQTADNGCESDRVLMEVIVYPIYDVSICYVSSDETETIRNRIFINNNWNYNVDKYQIFREGDATGIYDLIGEISSNENSFLDLEADNSASSYKYKVKTKDISGLVSNDSSIHKTILLQSSLATNNNVNLSWTTYDGIGYGTYTIYRKVNDGVFEFLKSTSASNLSYTDVTANTSENKYSYYVSIAVNSCSTSSSTKLSNKKTALATQIRSNYKIISKQGNLGIEDNTIDLKIKVYPNPTSQLLYVSHPEQKNFSIRITDLTGKQIYSGTITTATPLEIAKYPQGMYLVTVASKETNQKNTFKILKK